MAASPRRCTEQDPCPASSRRDHPPHPPAPGATDGRDPPGRHSTGGAQSRGHFSSPTRALVRLTGSPRSSSATRQVTGAALSRPSSFPPLTPPSGPASRHPLPSPAPMWRPGRGRQGRQCQSPPLPGPALAPAPGPGPRPPGEVQTARLPPKGRGPASADGSGARRVYRPLRAPI